MATALSKKLSIMIKQRNKHTSEILVVINKMDLFLQDTDFTLSGMLTTVKLYGKIIVDPSHSQDFINHAVEVSKTF